MIKATLLTFGALTTLVLSRPVTDDAARKLADGKEFAVDAQHSTTIFRVQHLKAGQFYGRFNSIEGRFKVDDDKLEDSFFDVTIPVESIDSNDKGRDDDLRGSDFFSAKEFPSITMKSTAVAAAGEGRYRVTADLTMRGETKSIEFDVVHTGTAELSPRFGLRTGYEATFTIDRTEFGMDFYAKQGVLGTKVQITVAIEGMLPK